MGRWATPCRRHTSRARSLEKHPPLSVRTSLQVRRTRPCASGARSWKSAALSLDHESAHMHSQDAGLPNSVLSCIAPYGGQPDGPQQASKWPEVNDLLGHSSTGLTPARTPAWFLPPSARAWREARTTHRWGSLRAGGQRCRRSGRRTRHRVVRFLGRRRRTHAENPSMSPMYQRSRLSIASRSAKLRAQPLKDSGHAVHSGVAPAKGHGSDLDIRTAWTRKIDRPQP